MPDGLDIGGGSEYDPPGGPMQTVWPKANSSQGARRFGFHERNWVIVMLLEAAIDSLYHSVSTP